MSPDEYKVVKTKRFPVKPMEVEEAILQMNMLDHTFFVFRNAESGEINVVYKRHDGNYALIEPERINDKQKAVCTKCTDSLFYFFLFGR